MKLVDVSVKRPVGVIMLVIAALVLGAISLKNLAIDLMPEIDVPVAVVITNYDGAAPQEIEQLVTRPIEGSVGSIEGIRRVDSVSSPGTSLVVLQFDWGRKIEESMNDIRERVDQVSGMLPEDAAKPTIIRIDPQAIPVMWIGVSGDSLERLQEVAEDDIQPYFERVPGVASASIEGGNKREIQVELDQTKLTLYGITGSQVAQIIGGENRAASAGNLSRGNQELQLRIDGEFTSLADIENTPITLADGRTIKVKDVAAVKDVIKDGSIKGLVNGEPALVMAIMKQSDGNTVAVSDGMKRALSQLQSRYEGSSISLDIIMDTSDYIRDSINSVVNNMLLGAALSIFVLLVFLRSIRTTLVIGISIPIAIISTFTLMYFTGETLNILSMGGLALGLGMMVDSAIVILENIFLKRQKGMSLIEAAKEGASELGPAVFASTMTSIVVFLPIVFVEGLASQIFRPLAYTVAFALLASLIVSLTLIPMLSSKMLGKVNLTMDEEEPTKFFDKWFNKLKARYEKILKVALRKRKTTVALTFLLLIVSFGLTPFIGMEFMPSADQGQLQINVVTQTGAKLSETEEVVQDIFTAMEPYREAIQTSYVTVGGGSGFGDASTNQADFIVQLVHPNERSITTEEFVKSLEKDILEIPGAEVTISAMDAMGTGGSPIQININGPDLDVLDDLSQQIVWLLEDIEGTANVETTLDEGRPELTVKVDREMASAYGLSYQQVMSELSLGFTGQLATRYRESGSEYDVRVLFPEERRETIRDLETMVIRNNQGVDVPLRAVAELRQTQGPAEINRSNQQREVRVTSEVRDRDLGSIMREINTELSKLHLPEGYQVSTGGEIEDMMESFGQLGLALLLSIFLVYMVMAIQFESFVHPFVIMFSLPTTIIGVLVGLFITGKPLSVPAFIGLIMLAGIVVNNAIVLVSYINILRDKGMERFEAIMDAGRSRLRPILMTTLTTALAMVPLALELGQGAESQSPMAVVIIFGLLFSTVFTLVLIPVVYVMIDNMRGKFGFKKFRFPFRRKKDKVENTEVTEEV